MLNVSPPYYGQQNKKLQYFKKNQRFPLKESKIKKPVWGEGLLSQVLLHFGDMAVFVL